MKTVLYVPLDDRPANLDDVIVQGKAAGIHIVTPNLGDIQNRLDSEKRQKAQHCSAHLHLRTVSRPTFIRLFCSMLLKSMDSLSRLICWPTAV